MPFDRVPGKDTSAGHRGRTEIGVTGRLLLDQEVPVLLLKQMIAALVAPVESLRIPLEEPVHGGRESALRRLDLRVRFHREADANASLAHPKVCSTSASSELNRGAGDFPTRQGAWLVRGHRRG
jgi:hypothetical protein